MSAIGKLVSVANALESIWVIYVIIAGFKFGASAGPAYCYCLVTAPWWLLPLILLQLLLSLSLLGAAIGCFHESREAYLFGAVLSAGALGSYLPILSIVPIEYYSVVIAFSVTALVLNIAALLGSARS